jgi:hypothetical protein
MKTTIHRRSALQGLGVGAFGLAGAALLGCGGSEAPSDSGNVAADESGKIEGGTSGFGLTMVAPKVEGREQPGGTFTVGAGATTQVQFDAGTALGRNPWHTISEKGIEPHPVTGKLLPHTFTSWEVADPSGTSLVFKMHPKLFIAPADKEPWKGALERASIHRRGRRVEPRTPWGVVRRTVEHPTRVVPARIHGREHPEGRGRRPAHSQGDAFEAE